VRKLSFITQKSRPLLERLKEATSLLSANAMRHGNGANVHTLNNLRATIEGAAHLHHKLDAAGLERAENKLQEAFDFLYRNPVPSAPNTLRRRLAYEDGYESAMDSLKGYKEPPYDPRP
jgi:hypothetical protein